MAINKTIPIRISPCPIKQAVLEVRFVSEHPADAVFGMVYSAVKDMFHNGKPEVLPIMQVPETVRQQDPNLKYRPGHRFVYENLSLSIGASSVQFGVSKPYPGWDVWSHFFNEGLFRIRKSGIFHHVERVSLRYINLFSDPIFHNIDLKVIVTSQQLWDEPTNVRTEIRDSGFIKVLQIGNSVQMTVDGKRIKSSVIDIDCLYDINVDGETFFRQYWDIVQQAHEKERYLFFNLLNNTFIEKFNPEYGE
jgi:uncharacterized protein (TIGR04255 family)